MRYLTSIAVASLCSAPLVAPPATAAPPLNMTEIGHLDLNTGCGFSDALFVYDGIAYVMERRGSGTPCGNYEAWLNVIDVSDPTAPALMTDFRLRGSNPGDMHGIYYSNGYLYCAIQQQEPGVSIYDMRNPLSPVEVAFVPIQSGAHTLRVAEGRLYVMPNSDPQAEIVIYDVSDPASPTLAGNFYIRQGGFCHDLSVMDGVGYASCWDDGFYLLDLANPANIRTIGIGGSSLQNVHSAWPTPDRRTVVTCQETDNQGVRTFDVTDPTTPTSIGRYNLGANTIVHDVMVVGRYAYVTYYGDDVKILDLSDPTNPTPVASFDTAPNNGCGFCDAIAQWVEEGVLYVIDMETGLWILSVDLPNPAPVTLYAVKSPLVRDAELTWNHTGESQYTLRDGLDRRTIGTKLTDIDGATRHTERDVVFDGLTHYYKLNGPWR